MATAFYGGNFFGGEFFSATGGVVEVGPPLGGKGDNKGGDARRRIYKPTGILHLPKKGRDLPKPFGPPTVDDRLADSLEIARQVHEEVFHGEPVAQKPIITMNLQEIEAEIGSLLRKKMRTEEEEIILLTLLAALA